MTRDLASRGRESRPQSSDLPPSGMGSFSHVTEGDVTALLSVQILDGGSLWRVALGCFQHSLSPSLSLPHFLYPHTVMSNYLPYAPDFGDIWTRLGEPSASILNIARVGFISSQSTREPSPKASPQPYFSKVDILFFLALSIVAAPQSTISLVTTTISSVCRLTLLVYHTIAYIHRLVTSTASIATSCHSALDGLRGNPLLTIASILFLIADPLCSTVITIRRVCAGPRRRISAHGSSNRSASTPLEGHTRDIEGIRAILSVPPHTPASTEIGLVAKDLGEESFATLVTVHSSGKKAPLLLLSSNSSEGDTRSTDSSLNGSFAWEDHLVVEHSSDLSLSHSANPEDVGMLFKFSEVGGGESMPSSSSEDTRFWL